MKERANRLSGGSAERQHGSAAVAASDESRSQLRIGVVGIYPRSIHLLTYVRYLVERGHDVTVITNAETVDAAVRVVNFGRHTRLIRFVPSVFRVALRAWRVRRALVRGRFDVVNIQQMTPDGVYGAVLSPSPVVPTFWGSDILRLEIRPWFVRRLMPRAIRRAAAVHATCREIASIVIEMGAQPEKVETFNYGVDLGLFTTVGPEQREAHRVISTRGLRPFYRIADIVAAFPTVVDRYPDARLVLVGDGQPGDKENLEAAAAEAGIPDHVEFTGRLEFEGVASELRRASVWVSIPPTDSFALSLQEAMACGTLPVVADIPAMREGLDETRGILLPVVNAEAVGGAMIEGIERAALGEHLVPNRRFVEEHGDRRVNLARYESLLARVASRSSSARGRGRAV